ncbi:MAG: Coenzyme F420 hydrogenase/dehydrogenase, beta subunit C-terminal domain, partial [Candidatus Hydrothermarchaeales archaeon]
MSRRFEELKAEVIDPGFCVSCGACTGFCNRLKLNGIPKLVGECVEGCASPYGEDGACYEHCPMVKVLEAKHVFQRVKEDDLGNYRSLKAARGMNKGMLKNPQDGGVATMILKAAFESGKIDAAIVVGRDEEWRSQITLIRSAAELEGTEGSKYTETPVVHVLGEASRSGAKSVAVVAVSCQIQALRNLEYGLLYPNGFSPYSDMKIYAIGLFCSGIFQHNKLMKKLGVEPSSVSRMDVSGGTFNVDGEVSKGVPLKEVKDALLPSCPLCLDYTSKLADISLGSVGTSDGWTTVIERTPKGFGLLKNAIDQGLVEATSEVDEEALRGTVTRRRHRIERNIKKSGENLPP